MHEIFLQRYYMKWVPGEQSGSDYLYICSERDITLQKQLYPSTIHLAASFIRKMPQNTDSMYSSIFKLENIEYDFT